MLVSPTANVSPRNMPTQTAPTASPSALDTATLSEASAADWRAVIPAVSYVFWVCSFQYDSFPFFGSMNP